MPDSPITSRTRTKPLTEFFLKRKRNGEVQA